MNIKLENVRLSYPSLFKPKAFEDGGTAKFSASFILDKKTHAKKIKEIQAAIAQLQTDAFKGKVPKNIKICLRDGSEKEDTDGYGDGVMFISSSSSRRPPVVDRDLSPLTETDTKPYAGCFVNATVRLWVQDNQYGKRVNAELRAVQFAKDGEAFGATAADPNSEFSALEGEDDDAAGLVD